MKTADKEIIENKKPRKEIISYSSYAGRVLTPISGSG